MNLLKSKFFLSFAMALIAGLLAWLYLDQRENELLRRGKLVKVISAKRSISAYTRLRGRDLVWREIPAEYTVKGYILSEKDAVDQLALVPFNAGEPLTYNKISSGNASLSNSVPEGLRAISIPVNKVSGIAGMVRPGDLVDVLYLDDPKKANASVSLLFQGVKILAAGEHFSENQEKADTSGSVTLALSPEDTQLAMLAFSQGVLQLSLRAIGDSRIHPSKAIRLGAISERLGRFTAPKIDDDTIPMDFIPQKR
jgi:pilus assembly protein CpaB